MDDLLKLTADASVEVSAAEAALDDDDPGTARAALDRAEAVLQTLRERWPAMSGAERQLVGRAAGTVRARMDEARGRLPVRRALSEGAPEEDPEQDAAPDGVGDAADAGASVGAAGAAGRDVPPAA